MDRLVPSFSSKTVLITGGTQGLGRAIGQEFACLGATTYLTHRWGSADEDELRAEYRSQGGTEPRIIESDVSDPEATLELMTRIKSEAGHLDAIISNVAFAKIVRDLADLTKSALDLSLNYSAWPLVQMTQLSQQIFGCYPRYLVAVSSNGVDICYDAYDIAGVSKAVLETFCRYLALRLRPYGVRVNAIRPGLLDTESSRDTFGDRVMDTVGDRAPGLFMVPASVAKACVALCSGWLDAVTGQVITVDEGWSLVSQIAYLTASNLPATFPAEEASTK